MTKNATRKGVGQHHASYPYPPVVDKMAPLLLIQEISVGSYPTLEDEVDVSFGYETIIMGGICSQESHHGIGLNPG